MTHVMNGTPAASFPLLSGLHPLCGFHHTPSFTSNRPCWLHPPAAPICRKEWTLLRDDSIFVDWQRLKVQENVEEVSWCLGVGSWGQAREAFSDGPGGGGGGAGGARVF
jgi:hypothetical protein